MQIVDNGKACGSAHGLPPLRAVAAAALLVTALLAPAPAAAAAPPTFGACAHFMGEEHSGLMRSFHVLKAAGLDMVRLDFWWDSVEMKDGTWNFRNTDEVIAAARATGITILPILDYSHPSHGMPDKDPGPWREYVRRIAERYAADCPVFEVWNEENGGPFDPTNYFGVLKSAYEEIKAVAPNARVAIGGLVNNNPAPYIDALYALGGGRYFDIMNLHPYSDMRNNPEGLLDPVLEAQRAQLKRLGDGDKPIWITEFGWSTAERKPGFVPGKDNWRFQGGADETTAAWWTARALGIAFAEGVEAVFHYELRSLEKDRFDRESHFGLIRDNFTPMPAYLAYAAFIAMHPAGSERKDLKWRRPGRPGQALYFPQWTRPAGGDERIHPLRGRDAGMVWTTGFEGVRHLKFGGAEVRFFDVFGKELYPPRAEDGGYDVHVSGSPVYFVGATLEEPFSAIQ